MNPRKGPLDPARSAVEWFDGEFPLLFLTGWATLPDEILVSRAGIKDPCPGFDIPGMRFEIPARGSQIPG